MLGFMILLQILISSSSSPISSRSMTHWWNGMYVKPSSSSSSSSYASWGLIGVSWSCSSSSSFFFMGVFRVSWSSSPSSSSSWVYQGFMTMLIMTVFIFLMALFRFNDYTNHPHLFCHEFYLAFMIILIIIFFIFFISLLRFHNHANHHLHLLHVNLAKAYLPKKFRCQKDGEIAEEEKSM